MISEQQQTQLFVHHHRSQHVPHTSFVSCLPITYQSSMSSSLFFPNKNINTTTTLRRNNKNLYQYRSTRASLSSTTTTTTTTKNISIHDANVVIVGGGPVGSFAATMLHIRGIRATLIEKDDDFLNCNVYRSFALGLFNRGVNALKKVPGLYDFVSSSCSPGATYRRIKPNKDVNLSDVPSTFTIQYFMRFRLLHLLKTFVLQRTNTQTYYGYQVVDVQFLNDGEMILTLSPSSSSSSSNTQNNDVNTNDNETTFTINTRMILACDGRNSVILNKLQQQRDGKEKSIPLFSKRGFQSHERNSPAVGMQIRSLILNHNVAFQSYGLEKTSFLRHITVIEGSSTSKPFVFPIRDYDDRFFSIGVFPTVPTDIDHLGGVLAVIVRPANHQVWQLKDTESAFELFETNFPQLNIRECISNENMTKFIQQRPGKFPPVTRPASLTASIIGNKGDTGCVILLGEAAHAFPPDTGQGVNAGLDDVVTLMQALDSQDNNNRNIMDIAKLYDEKRDKELWALMRIAQVASPYQYKQSKIGFALQIANFSLRAKLHKEWPQIFHPPLASMLSGVTPYSEMLRNANITTTRIYMALALIVSTPVALLMGVKTVF